MRLIHQTVATNNKFQLFSFLFPFLSVLLLLLLCYSEIAHTFVNSLPLPLFIRLWRIQSSSAELSSHPFYRRLQFWPFAFDCVCVGLCVEVIYLSHRFVSAICASNYGEFLHYSLGLSLCLLRNR